MKRLATALMLGWLLWVEMQDSETRMWSQVDRREFATYDACERERSVMIATAQPEGVAINFLMTRPEGVGNTFIVNGDRVRISVCLPTSG